MKDHQENRIARDELVALLSATMHNMTTNIRNSERIQSEYFETINGKEFVVIEEGIIFSTKKSLKMDLELFKRVITNRQRMCDISNHLIGLKHSMERVTERFNYYNALVNVTVHISFDEFTLIKRLHLDSFNYNPETMRTIIHNTMKNKCLDFRPYPSMY